MKQAERVTRSKELIYQAALSEFGANGYEATSIEMICHKHGISKGMIYHYYANKDDLLLVCVQRVFDDIKKAIEEKIVTIDKSDIKKAISDYLMFREEYFKDHPLEKKVFEVAMLHTPENIKDKIQSAHQPLKELNHDFFSSLIKKIQLRENKDHDEIMRYLETIATLFRTILERYREEELDLTSLFKDTNDIMDLILFGVIKQ